MARTVKKISSAGSYDVITHTPQDYYTQTPGNYNIDNYYLRELQDKVDAEWNYRPNRIQVEYETIKGSDERAPVEVVSQSVKNEKGKPISEDFLNLVFRDIQESRFDIGHKFRFSRAHNLNDGVKDKNIWLVINRNLATMTSSVVVQRCNGTLASQWIDEQGVAHNHYEPAILSGELNSVNLFYNSVADSPQAHLVVTVQWNDFTAQYQMNQRFILGAHYRNASGERISEVYRIKTIDRFYGLSTNDSDNVGLVKIYMEITESSEYDNFETRIAYQEDARVTLEHSGDTTGGEQYKIIFTEPQYIPTELDQTAVIFVPVVVNEAGRVDTAFAEYFETNYVLENCPVRYDGNGNPIDIRDQYINFEEFKIADGYNEYSFSLQRKRIYLNGDVEITCKLPAEHSPTHEELTTTFKLVVSKQEA